LRDDASLNSQEVIGFMICVMEYGENIGTLRNLFQDFRQALIFAEQLIELSNDNYESIGPNQWYCQAKKEYVKIEDN
jgi:hypothetical protein